MGEDSHLVQPHFPYNLFANRLGVQIQAIQAELRLAKLVPLLAYA
jgi:hypothetical protein